MGLPRITADGQTVRESGFGESETFINKSSLPSWLSKYGGASTTLTFGSDGNGLNIECANVDGGIIGPEIDISNTTEVRVGATYEPNFNESDSEWFGFGLSHQGTEFHDITDGYWISFSWYDDSTRVEAFTNGENAGKVDPAIPSLAEGNGSISFELRLRPSNVETQLFLDDGLMIHRSDITWDETQTYYPAIGIDSSLSGTTKTMDVQNFYYEIVR